MLRSPDWREIAGDAADDTGSINGDSNRKRGDFLITVNTALTEGVEAHFTVEAMDRSDVSQRAVLKELSEAKVNRNAHAAIAVIASRKTPAAAEQALRWFPENRFICVLDKDDWSPLALEVAYCWARVEVLKASSLTTSERVDVERIQGFVDEAARHLTDLERLRTKLSVGRTALRDSESIISEFEGKLVSCLARISSMLTEQVTSS